MSEVKTRYAVLGPRASAKTTTLAHTYMKLSAEQINGYLLQLNMSSFAYTQQQEILDSYSMFSKGKKPEASAAGNSFEFGLSKNYEPVATVYWHDYPGGWYEGLFPTQENFIEYIEHLRMADLLIIIVPADVLLDTSDDEAKKALRRHIGRNIADYKSKAKAPNSSSTPIVFYMTKADKVPNDRSDSKKIQMLEQFMREFPLPNTKRFGCFSTLGRDLIMFDDGNFDKDTYAPEGFHIPFLLGVTYRLSLAGIADMRQKLQEIDALQDMLADISQERGGIKLPGNPFTKFFRQVFDNKGLSEKKQKIEELDRQRVEIKNQISDINQSQSIYDAYRADMISILAESPIVYIAPGGQKMDFRESFK